MMKIVPNLPWKRSANRVGVVALMSVFLAACGGSEDETAAATQIVVNTPAGIAQSSASDYDNNVNGIITGTTLKTWKDDWINERPSGVTGKLVILQVTEGAAGSEYVAGNGTSVLTYLVDNSSWVETRSNGVKNTRSMVLDGSSIDALLQNHNIDPSKDMIVCAQGNGSPFSAMVQGRCWYTLRYWGVDKTHLALLNGSNDWQVTNGSMTAADFTTTAESAPGNGTSA